MIIIILKLFDKQDLTEKGESDFISGGVSILKILQSQTLRLGFFLIIMLSAAFYLVLSRDSKSTIVQHLLDRQQIIARAEARNTEAILQRFGDAVATVAQLSSVQHRDTPTATLDLDTFVEQRRDTGLIGGVVLTDQAGIVQISSNILRIRDVGRSLSDRDFFIWAKSEGKKGEYFISQPMVSRLGATKGQMIVVVASPVYQNDKFGGVVAAAVILKPLVERFFGMMKISNLTGVYLVDEQGNLIYTNFTPDSAGSNISQILSSDQKMNRQIKDALGSAAEGQFQTDKHLVSYSPVELGTQHWLLVISSPVQEVVNLTRPAYIRQAAVLTFTALGVLLFGVIISRKRQF